MHPSDPRYIEWYETVYLPRARKAAAEGRAATSAYGREKYAALHERRAEIKEEQGEIGIGAWCVIVFLIIAAVFAVGANQ